MALKSKRIIISILLLVFYISAFRRVSEINNALILPPFFSNSQRCDLKKNLTDSLKRAQNQIYISVYSLSDPKVIHLINQKAENGLDVRLRMQKKSACKMAKKLSSKVQIIPANTSALMHQKIFLIDSQCYFGSSNLTTESLRMHENLMVRVEDKKLNAHLQDTVFTQSSIDSSTYQADSFLLYLLPQPEALDKVLTSIQSSQKSIEIAMFTLTHPQIIDALIEAHHRGVKVCVAVDHLSSLGASRRAVKTLKEHRVTVLCNRSQNLLHHKMAFIDHKIFLMGSVNWTQKGFSKNQECLLFFPELTNGQKRFIERVFKDLFKEGKEVAFRGQFQNCALKCEAAPYDALLWESSYLPKYVHGYLFEFAA